MCRPRFYVCDDLNFTYMLTSILRMRRLNSTHMSTSMLRMCRGTVVAGERNKTERGSMVAEQQTNTKNEEPWLLAPRCPQPGGTNSYNSYNTYKLWTAVYPSNIARTAAKLCQNAFQTIPNISFFDSRKTNRRKFQSENVVCSAFWLGFGGPMAKRTWANDSLPVSYTHLTLPTIYSV